ncbi:MAG: Co2+/Mg2+ efflux protein ApaG [Holosporales bacterium]|jgi:ApaG protein
MYTKTTHDITVTVQPFYMENQSNPDDNLYVWAYHVAIENNSDEPVLLKDRHWFITDVEGRQQEVHGKGVVGEQPLIEPGRCFEYMSGTPLRAPSGMMLGKYDMFTPTGKKLEISIPAFSLDSPHQKPDIN